MDKGSPLESRVRELTPDEVWRDFTPDFEKFGYETSEVVEPLDDFIGLERAKEAAIDGLDMREPGWNLYVRYGDAGRHSFVDTVLKEHGQPPKERELKDICLVHSFEPEKCDSNVLYLKPGQAKQLKQDVADFVTWLQEKVPFIVQSPEYAALGENLRRAALENKEALLQRLETMGLGLKISEFGTYVVFPLDEKDLKGNEKQIKGVKIVNEYLDNQSEMAKDSVSASNQLLIEIARADVDKMLEEMKAKYGNENVSCWLDKVGKDSLANLEQFNQEQQASMGPPSPKRKRIDLLLEPRFRRYEVNVQVDHSETPLDKPLIIPEDKPSRSKLAGKRKVYSTSLTTELEFDHMSVDLGSLVKAKGGYFVVDIEDMLLNEYSWGVFRKILSDGEVKLGETYRGLFGFEVEAPKIDGIDVSDVQVILIGEQFLDRYIQMFPLERDFLKKRFKVKVDFEPITEVDEDSTDKVAKFVRKVRDKHDLLHVDKTGLSAAAGHLVRMAHSKEKFSLKLGSGGLPDVLVEANHVAKRAGAEFITGEHFQQALDRRHRRIASLEDRYREFYLEDLATIDLEGERVGEAHALSVYSMADLQFCVPTKATAVTSVGKGEDIIVDVMGKANLAGEIYTYGKEEVEGYMELVFKQEPASFRARIVKEESYGGIDGNSSSALNTVVLLSELSGVPILQRGAMTGGVTQKGYVVPIGAETIKVEGFYEACKAKGILDEYDDAFVIVPKKNMKGLQLKPEVVQAIKDGKFHIYAVDRVEDAVELLTRTKAGAVFNYETGKVDLTKDKKSVYPKATKKVRHYTKMARR